MENSYKADKDKDKCQQLIDVHQLLGEKESLGWTGGSYKLINHTCLELFQFVIL